MRLQHKFGIISLALKVLSILAFFTLIFSLWSFHTYYPIYYLFNHGNILAIMLDLDWYFIIFMIWVLVAGVFDWPRILYVFPLIAYLMLVSGVCTLIENHKITYELHFPGMIYIFSSCLTVIIGLITLFFWHRKQSISYPTSPPSKLIKNNLAIIALLTYIVLVLDTMLFYDQFPYYLEKMSGSYAMAYNYGGIRDIIFWGIILISCIKKWPYVLWFFPLIAYKYLWLKMLALKPDSMTLSLKVLAFSSSALVLFGLYTLVVWVLENPRRRWIF